MLFMNVNNKTFVLIFSLIFLFLTSCGTDDINPNADKNIMKDAKKEDLYGIWSIFKVELQGISRDVPINLQECGRDFFIYTENQDYKEFIFQESLTCRPNQNKLKWILNDGVITLSNLDNSDSEMITINRLGENTFVFTTNIDLDGDNIKEKYTFTAYRYLPPNEIDIYTSSFLKIEESISSSQIEFKWNKYNGYNVFLRYEIYRGNGDCNISSAELIETIEDINLTSFIDENPPVAESLCYFLRIYTDKGLLGQSNAWYVATEFIIPKNVSILNSSYTDTDIKFSWEKYSGRYFSHYEIRVQDQNENSAPNIQTVKIIDDINITTFTDFNPPYVNNPIYSIYVHNKFGNISPLDMNENMVKIGFTRDELLDFDYITFLSFDSQSQSFFFYGKSINKQFKLIKYSYINKEIIAEAFKLPTSYTEVEMKLITSENGKELVFVQGGDLWIYDSENLNFKYSLNPDFRLVNSFSYLSNNIWVVSNSDTVFTLKRNGSEFLKIDEKPHFPDHQGSMNYEITKIDANNILLSHNNEGRAIHFAIDSEGQITNSGIKQLPLLAKYNSDISVNDSSKLLLNKKRNTIYSTVNYALVTSYTNPTTTLNFNILGNKIFGTDNDYNLSNNTSNFKKEIIVFDISSKSLLSKLSSKGYPLYLAEDDLGNIISLSSGFPRMGYFDIHNSNVPDMFVEIIK